MADKYAESKGAKTRGNTLNYDPKALTIVSDKTDPLYDPRVTYDVPEWLVESIIEHGGVQVPIIVTRDGTNPDGSPIVKVVDGRQRVRACIEANRRLKKAGKEPFDVPTVSYTSNEEQQADLVVVLNEHRLADTPSVRAEKMAQMSSRGRSNADIARAFRVSGPTVASYLKLAGAAASVQRAVDKGELPLSTVAQLADLPRAEQAETVKKMIAEGTTRGKAAKEAAAEANGPRPKKEPKAQPERIENKLTPLAQAWSPDMQKRLKEALAKSHDRTEDLDSEDYEAGVLFGINEVLTALATKTPEEACKTIVAAIEKSTQLLRENEGAADEEDGEGDDG